MVEWKVLPFCQAHTPLKYEMSQIRVTALVVLYAARASEGPYEPLCTRQECFAHVELLVVGGPSLHKADALQRRPGAVYLRHVARFHRDLPDGSGKVPAHLARCAEMKAVLVPCAAQ